MKIEYAEDVREIAVKVNEIANLGLDLTKVEFIRSYGTRSRAIARVLMLPSQWRFVLKPSVLYIVEVISERYDSLECEQKVEVILHELFHIPKKMSGGLRKHNFKEFRRVREEGRKISQKICL